jgi:hypothetical protein
VPVAEERDIGRRALAAAPGGVSSAAENPRARSSIG